jgi:hypothetical protein
VKLMKAGWLEIYHTGMVRPIIIKVHSQAGNNAVSVDCSIPKIRWFMKGRFTWEKLMDLGANTNRISLSIAVALSRGSDGEME